MCNRQLDPIRTNRSVYHRSGVMLVETAIVLPVLLLVLFAMLDLGIAATRYNALANASRSIAREAILHGSLAPEAIGTWGPASFSGTAADSSIIVASVQGVMPTMNNDDVRIVVSWPDNSNAPRDRVKVVVEYQHQTIVPGLFPWGPLTLNSLTTMRIVN